MPDDQSPIAVSAAATEAARKASTFRDLPDSRLLAKFVPPNMSNMTDGAITDEVGNVRKWMAYLKTVDTFLGEALKSRTRDKLSSDGEVFHMSKNTYSVTRIVPDLCREHLDADMLEKVSATGDVTTMNFSYK